MAYKLRVILDVKEDVFRDIIIDENKHLESLHFTIAKAFNFNGKEMASFYKTNANWEQGEEIPLFNMTDHPSALHMKSCIVKDIFCKVGGKLIYVYDFLAMWTFFIELKEIQEHHTKLKLPSITLAFGNTPKKAPEKTFKAETSEEDLFNDMNSFDDFEEY